MEKLLSFEKFKIDIREKADKFNSLFNKYDFHFCSTRLCDDKFNQSKFWGTIFVSVLEKNLEITIGKIVYLYDKNKISLFNLKSYKPADLSYSNDDRIWSFLRFFIETGKILNPDEYDSMVIKSKEIGEKVLQERREWRKQNNPNKKRKKLQGTSLYSIISNELNKKIELIKGE